MSETPKLCKECDARLHRWMAGQEKDNRLCEECSNGLVDFRAKNSWLDEIDRKLSEEMG